MPARHGAHRARQRQVAQAHAGHDLSGTHFALGPLDAAAKPAGASQLAAQEEVLHRVQVVAQREILVDGLDAVGSCIRRAVYLCRHAFDLIVAGVKSMYAGHDFDQGGLSCAVVSHQRDHLTRVDLDGCTAQSLDRPK